MALIGGMREFMYAENLAKLTMGDSNCIRLLRQEPTFSGKPCYEIQAFKLEGAPPYAALSIQLGRWARSLRAGDCQTALQFCIFHPQEIRLDGHLLQSTDSNLPSLRARRMALALGRRTLHQPNGRRGEDSSSQHDEAHLSAGRERGDMAG